MNDQIPNLTIERSASGSFKLHQDAGENLVRLELHEIQVQHLAVMAGLVPAGGVAYLPPAWVLARRLRVLRERINELDDRLGAASCRGQDDLEHELAFSMATWEMAVEFCADIEPHTARGVAPLSPVIASEPSAPERSEQGGASQLELQA